MAITVKHTKVSTVPDTADTSLVRPSDWNADHTLTGLGTMAEQDANNVNITGGAISGTTVSGYIPTSEKGAALGVATLDSGGKVPTSQIPQMGDLNYQGTWNASTNSPTLTSSTGTKGYYYVVNVAGTTNLDGITDWQVGDWAVFNGTVWQKIDNTDAVTSVNGYTGTVVLTYSDVGAANAPTNTNITSMTGVTGGISSPDYIAFDTTYATTLTAGQLGWDGNNTLGLGMAGGNVVQHIGEDLFFYCKASSAITKGQVVMFTGAVGASGVPTGAPATGITDGTYIMGVAAESIALNGFGLIQAFGEIRNVNTSGYADGDILWYDPSVTGGLTKTKPSAPNVKVQMAAVINGGSAGGGTILVRIDSGSTLGGTDSNAQITSPANGNILTYDGTNAYWKNTDLTAGTAISVSKSATGVLTVANTAPDQTVAISSGTGISVTGTYPNFTVTNTAPSSGGTVTSVTGTAPISSTGGTTPAISISQATTSTNGYLSSTDWNTFNNKQPAGTYVTSVGATSPVTSTGGTTPTIAMPQATGSVSGYLSSTDWTTFNSKGSGTVTSVAASVPSFLSISGSPITSSGTLAITYSGTALPLANGGTAATTAPAANANLTGFTTTATAGGSTTLTNTSSVYQLFTGTTTQTVVLPVTSTLTQGWTFHIVNSSTGNLTVNSSGGNLVITVLPNTSAMITCILTSGTTAASWEAGLTDFSAASSTQSGYLTSTDWTTFNNKAASFTYTSTYIPYGQGTTTPNQASNFTFDGTTQTAPIQRASNGLVVNSKTVSANYTIASGDSAMSAGPVTVNSGVSVTISSGSRWVVL